MIIKTRERGLTLVRWLSLWGALSWLVLMHRGEVTP